MPLPYYGPRHSTTDVRPEWGARQSSENARDVQEALGRKVSGHLARVERYTASGSTSASIPLEVSGQRPAAVVLAHAAPVAAPSSGVPGVVPSLGFLWSPVDETVRVPEPQGLTAGVAYTLTFLVLEASS